MTFWGHKVSYQMHISKVHLRLGGTLEDEKRGDEREEGAGANI